MKKIGVYLDKIDSNKILNILLKIFIILIPIILIMILIPKNSIFNFFPNSKFGDEMGYYRVTDSFVNSKVKYGNYGISYNGDNSAKFGGFSAHGPMYSVFYGILGKLFGWHPYSLLLYNILLFIIAVSIVVFFIRNSNFKLFNTALLLFSFFPLLYFYVNGMMEMFHYILFIIYSVFLYKFFTTASKKNYIVVMILTFIITLFRINYIIFYVPVIFYYNNCKLCKKFFGQSILSFVISFIMFKIIGLFSAPFPNFISYLFELIGKKDFITVFVSIYEHSIKTLCDYFNNKVTTSFEMRFNILYLLIFALYMILYFRNFKKDKNKYNIYLYNCYIMIASFVLVITLYDVTIFKSIRILGSSLFLTILLLIYFDKKIVSTIIILLLIFITYFNIGFEIFSSSSLGYLHNEPLVTNEKTINKLNEHIVCKNTDDRWENTLALHNSYRYDSNIIYGIKSCIGINYLLNDDYSKLSKSKYILTTNAKTVNKKKYKFVVETDLGKLYINKKYIN